MLAVRRFAAGDVPAVMAIVRGLPDYFNSDVRGNVATDAANREDWGLADAGKIADFAIAARRSARRSPGYEPRVKPRQTAGNRARSAVTCVHRAGTADTVRGGIWGSRELRLWPPR